VGGLPPLPSRISLARAYAKAGLDSGPLLARLREPIPEGQSFMGPRPDDALLAKLFRAWPDAKLPETFPWSESREGRGGVATTFD